MEEQGSTSWFPASRRGWGWGVPAKWQGWLVLVAYFCLAAFGFLVLKDGSDERHAYFAVIVGAMLAVLLVKGGRRRS